MYSKVLLSINVAAHVLRLSNAANAAKEKRGAMVSKLDQQSTEQCFGAQ
jgi:hypothetical protein